jgi:hypothetical protein
MKDRSNTRQRTAITEYRVKKTRVQRTTRTDAVIHLRKEYAGNVGATPATYNRAFADVLRQLADAIAEVKNAWVDPEVAVWMHVEGEITAEVGLSPEE